MNNNFRNISIIILACLWLTNSLNINAQDQQKENKLSLNLEGGYQYTSIDDNYAWSELPKGKSTFNFGISGDYEISSLFKIGLGFVFDKRGFKSNDYLTPISELQSDDSIYVSYLSYYKEDLNYKFNYLTIPISLIYYRESEKISLYLKASLYYSLLLSAIENGSSELYIYPEHAPKFENPELQVPGSTITNYNENDVINKFNADDWGVQLNIGLMYKINERIGIYFSPGLTIALQQLYADPLRSSKWNNVYKVNIGINYRFKK